MFSGQAVISHLAEEAIKEDVAASSHWQKFHSEFKFNGQEFAGLQGFGGRSELQKGPRLWLSRILQRRLRRFGQPYPGFSAIDALAHEVTFRQQRAYDLDVLRQAITIAFLQASAPEKFNKNATGCVIGDGFASMSTLLLASGSAGRIVLVNLTKTLLVDLWYLKLWMGDSAFASSVDLVVDEAGLVRALAKPRFIATGAPHIIAVQASDHQLLGKCPLDFVINIVSMQEMNPPVVAAYFEDMRAIARERELLFYCCNREEKDLPDGTVTRFTDYPWLADDKILVDGLCPWNQYYYSTRPPFYRPYDGPVRHRLVTLSSH
ncbi:MAG: sugar O-methyltransferase [Pseudomonadota bacterium]